MLGHPNLLLLCILLTCALLSGTAKQVEPEQQKYWQGQDVSWVGPTCFSTNEIY